MKKICVWLLFFGAISATFAQDEAASAQDIADLAYAMNTMFMVLAGVLVMFMQAGFALLEAGLHSAKNVVNIFMKNYADFAVAGLAFWAVGFTFMYGGGFALSGYTNDSVPVAADFFFQMVFAGTAATIVSGAVGGRMKFSAYLIFSIVMTGLIYPYLGRWTWGGGWLSQQGFVDFAGSTIVHAVGGFAALGGVLAVGPRIGRYAENRINVMPGHNMSLAGLGVFILWLGWFGFNPGSQLAIASVEDATAVANIFLTTNLAASAGAIVALLISWAQFSKPDFSMTLNGTLAGLVGITAGTANVSPVSSVIIGAIAGVIVVFGIQLLDNARIDDPVGAITVHGICGVWGTLAVGIFSPDANIVTQAVGTFAISGVAFISGYVVFMVLKAITGLRVSAEDEVRGLDFTEHGTEAYSAADSLRDPVVVGAD
jgi:Amt family ammonium transporter